MSARILLIEDERGIADVLCDLLRSEDYEVKWAKDGAEGVRVALSERFDALVLDVMMPGKSGFEVCHLVREGGYDGGILMLTARGEVDDRVRGLRTGADDYLAKPFDAEELLARLNALLRRLRKVDLTPVMTIRFGKIAADFSRGEFLKDGEAISLSAKEGELLRLLVNHRGQVLSREAILAQVWAEQPHITPRTVDVHVAWLRQKIEEEPQSPRHLLTVRGEGYRFEV